MIWLVFTGAYQNGDQYYDVDPLCPIGICLDEGDMPNREQSLFGRNTNLMMRVTLEKPIPSPTPTGPVLRVATRAWRAGCVSRLPANSAM